MIKRSEITAPLTDERGNGLWAEFDDEESLTHIGFYRDGRPASACWTIDIDNEAKAATATREFQMTRSIDDAADEEWLRGILAKVQGFTDEGHRCSFCQECVANKTSLVTGPGVNICDKCVELSLEILIEADCFSRGRSLSLLLKKRGTNMQATSSPPAKD